MQFIKRWLPIIVSLSLLAVLISYAPWKSIGDVLSDLDLSTIIILIALSFGYYSMKCIRFWYILKSIGIQKSFKVVALSYMSAQPVSLLPAGEIYRSHSLRRYTGIPVSNSIGQFTLQGLLEGASMAFIMLVSALALGTLRIAAVIFCVFLIGLIVAIRAGYLSHFMRQFNRLPFIEVAEKTIQQFNRANRRALGRKWLPKLLLQSLFIEMIGTAIAYVSTTGVGGHINLFQASFLYILPVIIGFISFIPGGIGPSEQGAVGILLLSDVNIAIAVAATLLMRVTIVGLGFCYGLCANFYGNLQHAKQV